MHNNMPKLTKNLISKYQKMSAPVKASFWFVVCSFIQKGISFITVPLFTRLMSAEQYGLYSLYLSWDSIIIIFTTLNLSYQVFNNGLIKYPEDEDGYTASMLGLSSLCTTILFILYIIFHDYVNSFSGLTTPLFLLMFAQYYFSQAVSLWIVKEKFHYRYKGVVVITVSLAIVSSSLGVTTVLLSEDKVFARVASIAFTYMVLGGIIIVRLLAKSHSLANLQYWKYVLLLNLPLIPHYLSLTALGSVDRILINSICGASAVAYYSIAFNIASILKVLLSSINNSYIPWFYQKMRVGDRDAISKVSNELLFGVAAVSMVPALFGPEVVSILGSPDYMEGVWIMPAVSAGIYFTFVYSLFSNYELYFDESRIMMVASVGAAILDIVINILVLPVFGFVAAGYVSLLCYISLTVFHYFGMKRVSRQQSQDATPFQINKIILISICVLLISAFILGLYLSSTARFIAITALLIVLIIKRKRVMRAINEIR